MSERPIDSTFNRQQTVVKENIDRTVVEMVTELVIETALPLVLTQDPGKANKPNHQFVPESARLKVFGDEVTVLGKLSMPGRNVEIVARVLRARADGHVQPAINVDGPELPEETGQAGRSEEGSPARPHQGQGGEGDTRQVRLQRPRPGHYRQCTILAAGLRRRRRLVGAEAP